MFLVCSLGEETLIPSRRYFGCRTWHILWCLVWLLRYSIFSAVAWLTCCSFGREAPKTTFCQVHDVPLLRQALAPPVPGFGMWHAELRRLDKTASYTCPGLEGEPGAYRTVSVPRRGASGMQWFRHCNESLHTAGPCKQCRRGSETEQHAKIKDPDPFTGGETARGCQIIRPHRDSSNYNLPANHIYRSISVSMSFQYSCIIAWHFRSHVGMSENEGPKNPLFFSWN